MQNLYFISYRLSMIFILAYIMLFSNMRYGWTKSILGAVICFVVSSALDYWCVFISAGGIMFFVTTVINFSIMAAVSLFLNKRRNFRAVFISLCGANYILPGNAVCYLIYQSTGDIFACVLAQCVVHAVLLFISSKVIAKDFRSTVEDVGGWGILCIVPLLFYCSISSLLIWPMNILDHKEAIPAVIFLFILMVFAFGVSVRLFAKKKNQQHNDMSLVFLAEYSDRLKSESIKVNQMADRLEEMNCAMQTMTTEVLDLLDKEKYEDIRTLVTALKSDSIEFNREKRCANNSINAVTLEVDEHAKRAGVEIIYNLNVPEYLGPSEFEYAVVVERILENAVKGCVNFDAKQLNVSMYPSGAWQNIEFKVKLSDNYNENVAADSSECKKLRDKILSDIDLSVDVPEISAFLKKYEVQRNIRFSMDYMISEFNVRIN